MTPPPRPFPNPTRRPDHLQAGTISRIRLENFMCHASLEIELGPNVNFITGQNGSGKSAILTALCVAFGSRARTTQRAHTLKDFIRTGSTSALIRVHVSNRGGEAFKPELYGDVIVLEKRIYESGNNTTPLRDGFGRKLGFRREDVRKIVEHFGIDVENPCVVMSQDKSREFLHSGNSKDRFRFYYKATLLERWYEVLDGVREMLGEAWDELEAFEEAALRPRLEEVRELEKRIEEMENVEKMESEIGVVRKMLAWSIVYECGRKAEVGRRVVEDVKGKVRKCGERIEKEGREMEELRRRVGEKRCEIDGIFGRTSEARETRRELEEGYFEALRKKIALEGERDRMRRWIEVKVREVEKCEERVKEFEKKRFEDTQAEEDEMKEKVRELKGMVEEAKLVYERSMEEEEGVRRRIVDVRNEIERLAKQIEGVEKRLGEASSDMDKLQMSQRDKFNAFGGKRLRNLLHVIELNQDRFKRLPIGPIGMHVELENSNRCSDSVENAIGWLLEGFIVTDHADARTLRQCARDADYAWVKIIIYDFSIPRLVIPRHMLPYTHHPTVFSVLRSENDIVLNVLVDVGSAERCVLVDNYDIGKTIAFDQEIQNLKEVYTRDGYKLFSRGSAQTTLPCPPVKSWKSGRLCGSFDDQIENLERFTLKAKQQAEQFRGEKRSKEYELKDLQNMYANAKRRRINSDNEARSMEYRLEDEKKLLLSAANASPSSSNVDVVHEEISKVRDEIQVEESLLETVQKDVEEARGKADGLQVSLKNLVESAKSEFDALTDAEKELEKLENLQNGAEGKKEHYEKVLNDKFLPYLKNAEAELLKLENEYKENYQKASVICPESEAETLQGCNESNPEELSARFTTLKQTIERENQRLGQSIDDLRMLWEQKERQVSRKQQVYKSFREKLEACNKALKLRLERFGSMARQRRMELSEKFDGNLLKKGITGSTTVNYKERTLQIDVHMPQDASNTKVRDTRGLSGGERSFSTLCFTLALHEMIEEAPFRAMDEFDVFMDAVSRKISLDTMVDFALEQGSQWIFITPHDIGMVKNDKRIKKQQLAAPRG